MTLSPTAFGLPQQSRWRLFAYPACAVASITASAVVLWLARSPAYANKVLLALTTAGITVGVTEFGLRWSVPDAHYRHTIRTGYPGGSRLLVSQPDGLRAVHRTNRQGFRGSDFSYKRSSNFRVACIGDSYTEGVGAEENCTWPAFVSQELAPLSIDVLNLGVAGTSLDQYAMVAATVAFQADATDIIICILPSDFQTPIISPSSRKGDRSYSDIELPQSIDTAVITACAAGWLHLLERASGRFPAASGMYWQQLDNAHLRRIAVRVAAQSNISIEEAELVVQKRLSEMEPSVVSAARKGEFNPGAIEAGVIDPHFLYRTRSRDLREPSEEVFEKFSDWLDWFADSCHQRQIRPWIVYFPHACQVVNGAFGPYPSKHYDILDFETLRNDTSISDLIGDCCRKRKVEFIDLTPSLRETCRAADFLRFDSHPSEIAYKQAAATIAQHLRRVLSEPD